MRRMVLAGLILTMSALVICIGSALASVEADQGEQTGEIVVWIGDWQYVLYDDGTACIVGVGDGTGYNYVYHLNQNGSKVADQTNSKHVVDDIPCFVDFNGRKYTITELGPYLFAGTISNPINQGDSTTKQRYFTEIHIPNTIVKIGQGCFQFNQWLGNDVGRYKLLCASDLKIVFGTNKDGEPGESRLEEIASEAFKCCGNSNESVRGLYEIELPESLKIIGDEAFMTCGRLKEINLSQVETIGDRAFMSCKKIVEVDLESAESIGIYAFHQDTSLKVKNLNPKCSYDSTSFATTNISFSADVGPDAVLDCGSFYFSKKDQDVRIISFVKSEGYDGNLTIPKAVTILSSMDILKQAKTVGFETGSELREIEGVASKSVFGDGLTKIDFSNAGRLETIGDHVFQSCSDLTSVDLSGCGSLQVIGAGAFKKSGLTDIKFPASLRIIGDEAFAYTSLESIDLSGVTALISIGQDAFIGGNDYQKASEVKLAGLVNLESIGAKAFYQKLSSSQNVSLAGCTALTTIGESAFSGYSVDLSGCSALAKVGAAAFNEVTSYESVPFTLEILNNGSVGGIAKPDADGSMAITSNTIAIDSATLSNVRSITIEDSSRFVLQQGILMNSDCTYVIKVVGSESSVEVPQTVNKIHPRAFVGMDLSKPISIASDVGVDWVLTGMTGLLLDSSLTDLMSRLDKAGYTYGIRTSDSDKTVIVRTELGFSYARPSISFADGKASIAFDYTGGYSDYDILISDGTNQYLKGSWSFSLGDNLELTVKARDRNGSDHVTLTFDPNGGTFEGQSTRTIQIAKGLSIIDSDLVDPYRDMYGFDGWKLKGSDADYDFDSELTGDLTFVAQWSYKGATISFDSIYGEISATCNGNEFESGSILGDGQLQLTFHPYHGYAFESWNVGGRTVGTSTLRLSNPDSNLTISVNVSSYSADALKSLVGDNPSIDPSGYSLSWGFGGVVDTSMQNWTGHPSTPVIADGYVYVRVGPTLYQLSLETGLILNTVSSVNQTDYYHHLGYGNGMLVDYANGKVYDSSMKHLFTMTGGTISFAYYTDGMFICMLDGKPAAYDASYSGGSAEDRSPKWTSTETGWFKLYGTASTPAFYDGYMYIPCVNGKDISIKSISISDGTLRDTTGALSTIRGQYLDDGWISIYDGTLYLTSYAYGLFGATQADIKSSIITSIEVNDGMFDDSTLKHTKIDGYDSLTSQFVVFNGRGYVYSIAYGQNKSALLVYDVDDMELIRKVTTSTSSSSVPTHGSIVVDASQATAGNDYAVKVYLLSYNDAKLYVMDDDSRNYSDSSVSTSYFGGTYCSQTVRFGQNGEMIWYDDSGYLWCYSSSVKRYVFISDGDSAKWYATKGAKASDAVKDLGTDVVAIEDTTKVIQSVNGKANGWSLYALQYDKTNKAYDWKGFQNLADSQLDVCHYFALAQGDLPDDQSTYTYVVGDKNLVYQFEKTDLPGDVVGKDLVKSTNVVRISFVDPEHIASDSTYLIVKDQKVEIQYPVVSRPGYSATWLDGSSLAPKGEVSYSVDKTFTLKWIQIVYDVELQGESSAGQVNYSATITRTAGTDDLDHLKLMIVVRYSDSKYLNLYSDIVSTDGSEPIEFGVSADGLAKVFVYVISGDPVGEFDRYGEASISYAG